MDDQVNSSVFCIRLPWINLPLPRQCHPSCATVSTCSTHDSRVNLRDVSLPCILHRLYNFIWQCSYDLHGIYSAHTSVQSLPPGHPATGRIRECDQALKDLGCAFLDRIGRILEAQEGLAVGASFLYEALGDFTLVDSPTESVEPK